MSRAIEIAEGRIVIEDVLADLGTLVRRVQAGSLEQNEFYDLTRAMRRKLKGLRAELTPEEPIDLTDVGMAIGRLIDAGIVTPATELFAGIDRAPTRGRFVVIEGGIQTQPNTTLKGA